MTDKHTNNIFNLIYEQTAFYHKLTGISQITLCKKLYIPFFKIIATRPYVDAIADIPDKYYSPIMKYLSNWKPDPETVIEYTNKEEKILWIEN